MKNARGTVLAQTTPGAIDPKGLPAGLRPESGWL